MSGARARLQRALDVAGPAIGLLLVMILFAALVPDRFLSAYNFKTIATQTVIVALGAIGMTWVMVSGGIDLSVGSVIALASVVTAVLLREGQPELVALLGGVAIGAALGAVNGLLITRLSIVPFIVTLGTMGIARGAAKYLADEQTVNADAGWLADLMTKTPDPGWLLLAKGVWITLALALVMALLRRRTVFGVHTFAIGSSEATARLCGVPVERVKVLVYVLAGVFGGLAGVLQLGRLTVGDPTTAIGLELDVIAAVVIGGGSLSGGRGSIAGALLGAFFMAVLANGCTLAGVPNYVQEILVGAIIIAAVALDHLRRHRAQPRTDVREQRAHRVTRLVARKRHRGRHHEQERQARPRQRLLEDGTQRLDVVHPRRRGRHHEARAPDQLHANPALGGVHHAPILYGLQTRMATMPTIAIEAAMPAITVGRCTRSSARPTRRECTIIANSEMPQAAPQQPSATPRSPRSQYDRTTRVESRAKKPSWVGGWAEAKKPAATRRKPHETKASLGTSWLQKSSLRRRRSGARLLRAGGGAEGAREPTARGLTTSMSRETGSPFISMRHIGRGAPSF